MNITSFQSRNRETFDSNKTALFNRLVKAWFQSRNRETFDSNLRDLLCDAVNFKFQSRNRETFDSNWRAWNSMSLVSNIIVSIS